MKFLRKITNSKFKLVSKLRGFKANQQGTAAIEFAFIAPIMIVTYVGLASVSLLVAADRSVSHTASVTADLVTQVEELDSGDIEEIFDAALLVMSSNYQNGNAFSIDVTSFGTDESGTVQQVGYASLGTQLTTPYDLPDDISGNLINAASGLVVTRVLYDYPVMERFVSDDGGLGKQSPYNSNLTETFMLKPRRSSTIPINSGTTVSCTITNPRTNPKANC